MIATPWIVGQELHYCTDDVESLGGWDDDEWVPSNDYRVTVVWHTAVVVRLTAKGGWVKRAKMADKWFAFKTRRLSATRDEAIESLLARRSFHLAKERRRLEIVQLRLRAVTKALAEGHGISVTESLGSIFSLRDGL